MTERSCGNRGIKSRFGSFSDKFVRSRSLRDLFHNPSAKSNREGNDGLQRSGSLRNLRRAGVALKRSGSLRSLRSKATGNRKGTEKGEMKTKKGETKSDHSQRTKNESTSSGAARSQLRRMNSGTGLFSSDQEDEEGCQSRKGRFMKKLPSLRLNRADSFRSPSVGNDPADDVDVTEVDDDLSSAVSSTSTASSESNSTAASEESLFQSKDESETEPGLTDVSVFRTTVLGSFRAGRADSNWDDNAAMTSDKQQVTPKENNKTAQIPTENQAGILSSFLSEDTCMDNKKRRARRRVNFDESQDKVNPPPSDYIIDSKMKSILWFSKQERTARRAEDVALSKENRAVKRYLVHSQSLYEEPRYDPQDPSRLLHMTGDVIMEGETVQHVAIGLINGHRGLELVNPDVGCLRKERVQKAVSEILALSWTKPTAEVLKEHSEKLSFPCRAIALRWGLVDALAAATTLEKKETV